MLAKLILFYARWSVLVCDGRCDKAWGWEGRPKRQLSQNEDDYVYLGDEELGEAPEPGRTAICMEGADAKPSRVRLFDVDSMLMNRWCARQCERSTVIDVSLPDMVHPEPNMLKRRSLSGQGG